MTDVYYNNVIDRGVSDATRTTIRLSDPRGTRSNAAHLEMEAAGA